MARSEVTEIRINEYGDETHESWIKVGASRITCSPGARLFDSEISHQHFIRVSVTRCTRRRDLNRDWLGSGTLLTEFDMSEAQWGAFVSSFGQGGGVPATLSFFNGPVPSAPVESRLGESVEEVRDAGEKALAGIQEDFNALEAAFERGAGKRELRDLIQNLHYKIQNGPKNMEFAATSLAEHTENVVTKARADIEAMMADAADRQLGTPGVPLLGSAEQTSNPVPTPVEWAYHQLKERPDGREDPRRDPGGSPSISRGSSPDAR